MDKKFPKLSQRNQKVEDSISIVGGDIYDPFPLLKYEHIAIDSGRITYLGKINKTLLSKSEIVIDALNYRVCPGFIDVHTYGGYGVDTHTCTASEMIDLTFKFPQCGVTAFVPSVGAGSQKIIRNAFHSTYHAMKGEYGAEIVGIYVEGLCANPNKRGAQRDIKKLCSLQDLITIIKAYPKTLKILMLAPELEQAANFKSQIENMERDVVFSIGHSEASESIAIRSFNDGYTLVTHLFNAMSSFHHRDIGIVGAALFLDKTYVEVIVDGVHVNFSAVAVAFRSKNREKFISITDSCSFAGLPISNQKTRFLGQPATVTDQGVFLNDGKLAASMLTLDQALRNLVEKCYVPFEGALCTITSNPANCLGMAKRIGYIRRGYDADIVLLDSNLMVVLTIGKGRILYSKLPPKRIERH